MSGTLRRLPRAAASAVGLTAAVAAIPALLIILVGNPLPAGLPSWAETQTALADGWKPPDQFVLGVLALILWVLWAQLMRHVAAEVRAQLATRHRQVGAPLLETGRRGLSRRAAGWLVGGLMAAGPLLPTASFAAPAPLPALVVPTHTMSHAAPPVPRVEQAAGPPSPVAGVGAPAAVPGARQYVVHTWAESKDCLWNIAERFLGDGVRWSEIEALNSKVAQPSGRTLGQDPRHWVYPGMVLRLPIDATGPGLTASAASASPGVPADATAHPAPVAGEGEPAEVPVSVPPPVTAASAAPEAAETPATTAAFSAPALPATPPATSIAGRTGTGPAVSAIPPAPAQPSTPGPASRTGSRSLANRFPTRVPLGVAGGVIAAGVGAELLRRRRRQLARRAPHERLPELTEPAAAAAATVAYSPVDDVDWLACELRLLVRGLAGPARARFEATVVQYHAQRTIEVGLARSCGTPPQGWTAGGAGGKVWTLDAPHCPAELASVADLPPCLPLLVSVGDEDTNGQVLLNLEAASAVGVVGDPTMIDALVRSVLWELATSPLAERLALVTLGVDAGDAEELARWRPAADAADVAATLRRATAGVDGALATTGAPTLPTARALGDEAWGPTVAVVASRFATPEILDAASGTGAVVVVVGVCPPDGLEVHVADGEVRLPSIGLVCVAQQLTRPAADALASLLVETAAAPVPADPQDDLRLPDAPPAAEGAPEEPQSAAAPLNCPVEVDQFVPARPAVLVRLLGPPSAEGTVKRVTPQQLSALAYLATHRNCTRSQVKDALWGDKHPTDKRWREFLSELRDTLPDRDAVSVEGDVVRVTGGLGCDVDQLEWLLGRAKASTGPKDRLGYLQAAVDLLRGVAFGQPDPTVSRYWRWLDIEYTNGHLWMQLTQAAYELGNLYLDAGAPAAASEVARKVLATARLDEGLTAVLMEAYRAQGSPDAAEKVYEAYDALLEEDGETAGEMTRRVIERIREERRDGFNGRPGRLLTLVRGPG